MTKHLSIAELQRWACNLIATLATDKANQVKENFLNNLECLPENNLLIINTPDNFNGAYILRNGVNDYLKFKETGKRTTQIDFQTFTNVNGGITFLENNSFKDLLNFDLSPYHRVQISDKFSFCLYR